MAHGSTWEEATDASAVFASADPRELLDALPSAILLIASDGVILHANRRAGEILGRPLAALEGARIDGLIAPLSWLVDDAGEEGSARNERRIDRPDGSTVTVGFSTRPVRGGAQVVVFQDISRWLALRDERDRLMRQAVVGEALPAILHELKNPLASLTTAVEVLLEEVPGGEVQERLHAILGEVRRLKLGFEGVGAVGRSLGAARHAAIDQACRDSFRVLAVQAGHAGVHTRCDVPDLPLLPLDPSVVRAIVFNLVTNALHACRAGNTIALHVRLRQHGQVLELAVIDNGAGMTGEVFTRCTELFFTTKRAGSGIGLALCKRTVEEAGGALEIRSVPGMGTDVTLRIPLAGRA